MDIGMGVVVHEYKSLAVGNAPVVWTLVYWNSEAASNKCQAYTRMLLVDDD